MKSVAVVALLLASVLAGCASNPAAGTYDIDGAWTLTLTVTYTVEHYEIGDVSSIICVFTDVGSGHAAAQCEGTLGSATRTGNQITAEFILSSDQKNVMDLEWVSPTDIRGEMRSVGRPSGPVFTTFDVEGEPAVLEPASDAPRPERAEPN